jgi:TonB family protein
MAEDTQPEDLPLHAAEPSEPSIPESLLYDPMEPEPGGPAGPESADGSSLFFRLALLTAALLVVIVFARGFWRPGRAPRRNLPEPAAEARSAVSAAPRGASEPPSAREAPKPGAEPQLVEELTSPVPRPRQPKPVTLAEATPKPVSPKPANTKAAAAPAKPKPLAKTAAEHAGPPPARRVPQPWEEGPQPPDLLKPGPGVEEPVPLALPRYNYPAAARGTGLQVDVRVAVLVDEKGRVVDARVREGAPPDLGFAETALAAAKKISFQPATRDEVPGKMWTEVILEFAE